MHITSKSNFDPSKIRNPYQVLAVFLLVVETLLGSWLFRAESSSERIVAGVLIVLVFGGFLYTMIRVVLLKQEGSTSSPNSLGVVTPAIEEVTEKKIEALEPEKMVGPDRSYIINKPPDDWITRELSVAEWQAEKFGVNDPAIKQKLAGDTSQTPKILVINTKTTNSFIPTPGKTTIDGVKLPTALEVTIFTQLAIIPIDRVQPPFFIKRPFEHNFYQMVSLAFINNVMTLYNMMPEIIPNTRRHKITAEFRQNIQYGQLNGNEVKDLSNSLLFIGIEGDIKDYIIIATYLSLPDTDDAMPAKERELINSLISSFRPVKVTNPEKQLQELRDRGDRYLIELFREKGKNMFAAEFEVFLYQISGLDLDNPDNRLRVMKLLKPFKILSDQVNLQDKQILKLWYALQEAEKGNASEFKQILTELVKLVKTSMESKATPSNENHDDAVSVSQDEGVN